MGAQLLAARVDLRAHPLQQIAGHQTAPRSGIALK
jgi:hypothetical protein